MLSPGISAKKRYGGGGGGGLGFVLGCGCKDAKSVSVSASVSASVAPSVTGSSTRTATRRRGAGTNLSASTTTDTLTLTSASSSFLWEDAVAEFDYNDCDFKLESSETTPSFSGLLRELNELEQSVVSWGRRSHHDKKLLPPLQEHKKVKSGGKDRDIMTDKEDCGGDSVEVGLDGSVAVVKQSEDPLSDFRQSMQQMIVENELVAGEDLREMLHRFLSLNAPHHHDVILRAFAEIWDDVFAASLVPVPAPSPARTARREQAAGRQPMPRTPPRRRHPPPAWRV